MTTYQCKALLINDMIITRGMLASIDKAKEWAEGALENGIEIEKENKILIIPKTSIVLIKIAVEKLA